MKKYTALMLIFVGLSIATQAQTNRVIIRKGGPRRVGSQQQRRPVINRPAFQPTVNISLGYGFPSTDKYQLVDFSNQYQAHTTQRGPFIGAIDYRFSRNMSIGVMGSYSQVATNYYNFNNHTNTPDGHGKLNSSTIMLNLIHYIPTRGGVEPYLRTAIGVNIWDQQYTDGSGNELRYIPKPNALAYQASFGAQFKLSKGAGLFLEAGYGKYILSGGLSLKF